MYRYYEALPGNDWSLRADAEFSARFTGNKYYIELKYQSEYKGMSCRRIIYDGKVARANSFAPGSKFSGVPWVVAIQDYGDGLARPGFADFPWDVAKLSSNVCDVERLVKNVGVGKIRMRETPEGDLVGSFSVVNSNDVRVEFECPKRFGFNIAKLQVYSPREPRPAADRRIEWKKAPSGLWYVRSLQEEFIHRDDGKRCRNVMKYTEFKPNDEVDSSSFTEAVLRAPLDKRS
jgi:hypothetical protein